MKNPQNWKLIGGLVICISYLVCIIALAIARSRGVNQWGDLFSLGQLIFDALLLPAAVIGFIIAIGELRNAQAFPRLALYWESEPGFLNRELNLFLSRQPELASPNGGRIVIVNEGNAVALWYLIHFDIPIHIFEAANLRIEDLPRQWVLHAGEQYDWRIDLLPEIMRVTFMSNGHVASYPDYPLPLGILNLPSVLSKQHRAEYKVSYIIATDQGKPSHNSLIIRLNSEIE